MFTKQEKEKALELYARTNSVKKTIIQLGYPTKSTLFNWIKERSAKPKPRRSYHMPDRPSRQAPLALKLTTLKRCFEAGEDVSKVAKEIG
ncbi:MAG TPA: helix-turn-helix domain-containing protein, partial [Oscillospiraceae bacterium]|nr:helix-turn-helix domain-containing protein [Oscillospiraceae bacterium]